MTIWPQVSFKIIITGWILAIPEIEIQLGSFNLPVKYERISIHSRRDAK